VQLNKDISRADATPSDILALYATRGADFSDVNFATAINWLAKRQPRTGYTGTSDAAGVANLLTRAEAAILETGAEYWDARSLANAAWGSAKLRARAGDGLFEASLGCLRAIATEATRRPHEFKTQELANIAWAFATAGIDDALLFAALAKCATSQIATFSSQEMANIAWAFSKRMGTDIGAASDLLKAGHDRGQAAEKLGGKWGRAAVDAADLLAEVARISPPQLVAHAFKPQEIANMCWSMATAGYDASDAFWDAVAAAATAIAHEPTTQTQNLANVVWAFAKAGKRPETSPACAQLYSTFAAAAAPRVDDFNSQELGNTAWAYATAGAPAEALLEVICASAERRVQRFTTQNLANMVWACATAGHAAPQFFAAVAGQAARRADEYNTQELANTAWAYATAGVEAKAVFAAVADSALQRLPQFSNQGITNLAWAFAKAGGENDVCPKQHEFFAALAIEAAKPERLRGTRSQGIANVAWAYATADHYAPALFDALKDEIVRREDDFNPQEIANTAWAFARCDVNSTELFSALSRVVLRSFSTRQVSGADDPTAALRDTAGVFFTPQELANLAWAFACVHHVDAELLERLWRAIDACARQGGANTLFSLEERRQLQQVILHVHYEAPERYADLIETIKQTPTSFTDLLRASLANVEASPSRAQFEVSDAIESLGVPIAHEIVLDQGLSIDVVVMPLERRIGIEFDGPRHYFRNARQRALGRSSFKCRLLAGLGWRVAHIPYWDWSALNGSPEAKKEHMRSVLVDILTNHPQSLNRAELRPPAEDGLIAAPTHVPHAHPHVVPDAAAAVVAAAVVAVDYQGHDYQAETLDGLKNVIRARNLDRSASSDPPKLKLVGSKGDVLRRLHEDTARLAELGSRVQAARL